MHDLFIGQTGSGKTFLAMKKAQAFLDAGFGVLVLENILNKWPCTWQTRCAADFIAAAKRSRRCALFIDDVGETLHRDPDAEWPFTMARHLGHKTHALAQGATQLLPVLRNQCSTLYLFADTDPDECKFLARKFNAPGLVGASSAPLNTFFLKARGQPLRGPLKVTA